MDRPLEQRFGLHALYAEMEAASLTPLWESLAELVRPQPKSQAEVHLWNYAVARTYLMRAGDLISATEAERRVLVLENPGLRGQSAIVPSLYAGLQLILPGESAPSHRHSQCALRFVLEGEGAFTAVDGEKATMRQFDLVLTPGWQWHEHGNPSTEPMIWLDGLDIPTVRHFDASFAERSEEDGQDELDYSRRRGRGIGHLMRPLRGAKSMQHPSPQPLLHYRYSDWRPALVNFAHSAELDPHLGYCLEFLNPTNGGPILPTIAAHVRLLPAGCRSRPRRSTDGSVFTVVEGQGAAYVEGREIELRPRDIFALPSWNELTLTAGSDLVLFCYSDRSAQEKLNLYRESNA